MRVTGAAAVAPKLHLRFEGGRAVVSLGRAREGRGIVVERLGMELDLDGAVQLSGGPARFRHHRARLTDLHVRLCPRALERAAAVRGVSLRIDGPTGGELWLSFRDAVGACAWRCVLGTCGADVLVYPLEASFVRRGPVAPWVRLGRSLRALGGEWSAELGAFRWRRPVRTWLAEVLLPWGWRVPEERGQSLRWVPSALALEVGAWEPPAELAKEAASRAEALEARTHRWCDPGASADGPAGDFARALQAGALREARRAAQAIGVPWVRADALEATAERFFSELDDGTLADLLLGALAERPNDVAGWRRWIEVLAEGGRPVALRLAGAALGGSLPRTTRAALAAHAVDGVFDRADPADLDRVDAVAAALVEQAERLAPELPEVQAARAALHHRHGDLVAAARAWERAAEEAENVLTSARWRRRAAELWLGLEGAATAEPLLRRALLDLEAVGLSAPSLVVQLAALRTERGDPEASAELLGKLLREPRPDDESWRAAALAAVRFHVERGEDDRARPFLAALGERACASVDDPELSFVLGETFSWPGAQGELSSASKSLDLLEGDESFDDAPVRRPPTRVDLSSSPVDGPPVTLVSVADDEVRALLREVRACSDPTAVLEAALEGALDDADPSAVRRVLRVLDRLDAFPGEQELRERATRLLRRLGGTDGD